MLVICGAFLALKLQQLLLYQATTTPVVARDWLLGATPKGEGLR